MKVGIDGDQLPDAVFFQPIRQPAGMGDESLLVAQVVEQDAAVEIHFRVVEKAHPGFRQ